MFFVASKVVGFFLAPSNLFLAFLLVGLALAAARRRSMPFLAAGTLGLAAFGLLPLGNLLILPLEERFPIARGDDRPVDGVIVLGGALRPETSAERGQLVMDAAAGRLFAMADLARRYPSAKIVFSGGGADLFGEEIPEADLVRRHAAVIGIDPARVHFENRSRTTAENAAFTRELLRDIAGQRWLLVTSAFHMPRAIGCFRHAGLRVEAYPVDYRTGGWADALKPNAFTRQGLFLADLAAKEWIGLAGYRLAGRIDELLPGPVEASTGGSDRR
jgi:uncharacterized SAM-binding protein YcdF (DUF218 family)